MNKNVYLQVLKIVDIKRHFFTICRDKKVPKKCSLKEKENGLKRKFYSEMVIL